MKSFKSLGFSYLTVGLVRAGLSNSRLGDHCQTIIGNILYAELDTILWTSEPYNGMFPRKKEGGATRFAIDQPVYLSTILVGGFIILEVLNEKGELLICMDVQKGTDDWGNSFLDGKGEISWRA